MNITPLEHNPSRILVVDDDKFTRIMLQQVLEKEGYQVEAVCNGSECLLAFKRIEPNLVLLDAMMPVLNGFDCCHQLRTISGSDYPPVLMITALEDPISVDRAFEAGATDYITKPIHWPVLRQRVRVFIEKSQLYQGLGEANRKLKEANLKLQQLASTDSLTKLFNRRYFDDYFDREWRRMARERSPLSLIMCDVDFFKVYNDTYGHQAGDNCLKAIAQAISKPVQRPADLVARYGGEELAVILPNTPVGGAAHIAQNIRSRVKALKITHANSSVSEYVTLSQGIACTIPYYKESAQILIAAADRALYRAKAKGRDCVVIHTD
ncbi:MAG: PleD family two-component system response regulator [Symploca sp. SIO2E9]|nr:PleD family two-component system response regulator [Symploca sp. SIO2E9]